MPAPAGLSARFVLAVKRMIHRTSQDRRTTIFMAPLMRTILQPSGQRQTPLKMGATVGREVHPAHLLVIGLVLLALLATALTRGGWPCNFVDAHAYARGLRFWLKGADPYQHQSFMNFLYPPIVLLSGAFLETQIRFSLLTAAYILAHVTAAFILPYILYRYYLKESRLSLLTFYFLFFFSPGLLGLTALETGNVALICYSIMLIAGIPGINGNNWMRFYLALCCCSMIKITFLPFLLLPLLCGTGQAVASICCGAIALTSLELQAWLFPDLYYRFKTLLMFQSMQLGDDGKGAFGILFHISHKLHEHSLALPLLGYLIVSACVAVYFGAAKRRGIDKLLPYWPALLLVGALFLTPRVNYYDLCIGFPIVFSLFSRRLTTLRYTVFYILMLIPSLLFSFKFRDNAMNGGFEFVLMLGMFSLEIFRQARVIGPTTSQALAERSPSHFSAR
jgi:hypothetical protein